MLAEISIHNFAVISEAKVQFGKGLNILSGETGAGKSVIIQALQLVMGAKGGPHLIRTGREESIVDAYFEYGENTKLSARLLEMGVDPDEALCIRRIIPRTGRGRVFINGTPVPLTMVSQIAGDLISVAGQHEYQVLLRPQNHLLLLDAYGGISHEREVFKKSYLELQALRDEYSQRQSEQKAFSARKELLSFQIEELLKADLQVGEEERLLEEKSLLNSAEKLHEWAGSSYDMLYAAPGSITERLSQTRSLCRLLAQIDNSLSSSVDSLDAAFFQIEDVAIRLRDYADKVHSDPRRLDAVEERLESLSRLKKKYGRDIPALCGLREELERQLRKTDSLADELSGMEASMADLEREVLCRAQDLSGKRTIAAKDLARSITAALEGLHMRGTRFAVDFKAQTGDCRAALSEYGMDCVEFLISPNAGEELKPLAQIASGGELSRITLVLKSFLSERDKIETMIFDEIDTGIGGATAEVVGQKLRDLAEGCQVICITHLPQIACLASRHFRVAKKSYVGHSEIQVRELTEEERVEEVARMLGGVDISEKTRAAAREMIERAAKQKN
ncbi:MAG: DNA repair protein RecN [Pseudomonadota bacterium]